MKSTGVDEMTSKLTKTEQLERLKALGKAMEKRRLGRGQSARPAYFPHAHFEKNEEPWGECGDEDSHLQF